MYTHETLDFLFQFEFLQKWLTQRPVTLSGTNVLQSFEFPGGHTASSKIVNEVIGKLQNSDVGPPSGRRDPIPNAPSGLCA